MQVCVALHGYASQIVTDPKPNQSCWMMLQTAQSSSQLLQTLSNLSHGEPALICEKHKAPVVDLPILVFCGKYQPVFKYQALSIGPTRGPKVTLIKLFLIIVFRNIHTSGLLDVIFLFVLAQRIRCQSFWLVKDLLRSCPALLEYLPVFWSLLNAPETVLKDIATVVVIALTDLKDLL